MDLIPWHLRKPVKRQGAERYIFITLLSFASSVTLTRIFLELTGYPRIGGGELHIAHVLWGGLMLFLASLVPLVAANRWAYLLSSILSGAGVGLFIDEVGKFITSNNNYFHPLAAPIIYAFFLLVVLLYLRIRRPPTRSPRAELFRSLDMIEEVLEHDLDLQELAELNKRLDFVANQTEQPHLARLATTLRDYLPSLTLVSPRPSLLNHIDNRWKTFENRWITIPRLRSFLSGGLLALGLVSISRFIATLPIQVAHNSLEINLTRLFLSGQIRTTSAASLYLASSALEASVGAILIIAVVLLVMGKNRVAINLAFTGLLFLLSAVNLLVFYFDQFSTILNATIQFGLLVGVIYYRKRLDAS